jgi:hypothetical protein
VGGWVGVAMGVALVGGTFPTLPPRACKLGAVVQRCALGYLRPAASGQLRVRRLEAVGGSGVGWVA